TNAVIIALLAREGVEAVAAWGAGNRLEALLLIASMAVSSILPPITAQNMGAGKPERVREALHLALRTLLIWQAALYAVIWLSAPWLAHFFTDDPAVAELIARYLHWIGWSWGLLACVYQAGAVFNGLGEGFKAMGLQIGRLVVLSLPLAATGILLAGVQGAFIGMALANTLAGLLVLFWVRPRLESAYLV
ncbi:MAG: MATE family efflux transporter, partial [Gammaproteobacteria bacterium]